MSASDQSSTSFPTITRTAEQAEILREARRVNPERSVEERSIREAAQQPVQRSVYQCRTCCRIEAFPTEMPRGSMIGRHSNFSFPCHSARCGDKQTIWRCLISPFGDRIQPPAVEIPEAHPDVRVACVENGHIFRLNELLADGTLIPRFGGRFISYCAECKADVAMARV